MKEVTRCVLVRSQYRYAGTYHNDDTASGSDRTPESGYRIFGAKDGHINLSRYKFLEITAKPLDYQEPSPVVPLIPVTTQEEEEEQTAETAQISVATVQPTVHLSVSTEIPDESVSLPSPVTINPSTNRLETANSSSRGTTLSDTSSERSSSDMDTSSDTSAAETGNDYVNVAYPTNTVQHGVQLSPEELLLRGWCVPEVE